MSGIVRVYIYIYLNVIHILAYNVIHISNLYIHIVLYTIHD